MYSQLWIFGPSILSGILKALGFIAENFVPVERSSVNREERGLLLYDLRLKRHLCLRFWSMARRGMNTSGNSHSIV